METKVCAQCGQEKPIADFCKACVAENERTQRHAKILLPDTADIAPQFCLDPRLYVATAAMQGLLSNHLWMRKVVKGALAEVNGDETIANTLVKHSVVSDALEIADSLLEELTKKNNNDTRNI